MQPTSSFMSGLYSIAEWIMRISLLNIIWLLFNIPMIVVLFFMLFSPGMSVALLWAIPLYLLILTITFPSIVAVFVIVRDWVMKKEFSSLWKTYWESFIGNYKSALWTGFILSILWIVWAIDFYYFQQKHDLLGVIFVIIGGFLFVFSMIYLSINVHYDMGRKEQLKYSILVTLGRPLLTLVIIVANVMIIYINLRFLFVFLFFSVSLSAIVTFYFFYRFTLNMKEKAA